MSELDQRTLLCCEHKFLGTNCKKCGIYFHPSNPAFKTNLFSSVTNCSAAKYLKSMRKRQCEPMDTKQIQQQTWYLLNGICEKFEYTAQTLALSLYIYSKTNPKNQRDEKFWASSSLLVASKAIQLDKRVPYLNRYQKYADKNFSQNDYENSERLIFQQMGYNLQFSTFLTFVNFYMTNGFLFQNDSLSPIDIKVLEDELVYKCKQLLKNASFLGHEPQKLALSLIKQIRTKRRLQSWPKQLQQISGVMEDQLPIIQKSNVLKPLCALSIRAKQKLSLMSQHNSISALQSSLQLACPDHKPKLIRRKNQSLSRHNVKENTFKPQPQQVHQILLSNIRKQNLSVSKHVALGVSNSSSLEKILPIGFHSRRV